jgi:hypothetical protein
LSGLSHYLSGVLYIKTKTSLLENQ